MHKRTAENLKGLKAWYLENHHCVPDNLSPEYVVAHAAWRKSRGRGPSLPYRKEKNPRKALALALKVLHSLDPRPGDDLKISIAPRLVIRTRLLGSNETTSSKLHGNTITAKLGDSVDDIVNFYRDELERRHEAWINSPEGQQKLADKAEKLRTDQAKVDELVAKLPELDFTDIDGLIDWLYELYNHHKVGVNCPWELVVTTFTSHDFRPGMNCNEDFDGEDRTNFAGYLIGIALGGLICSIHAIHQMYKYRMDDWRAKFPKPEIAATEIVEASEVAKIAAAVETEEAQVDEAETPPTVNLDVN